MTQLTPDIQSKQLEPYFIGRNDVINRWGNLISSYLDIPGLRFFAPMSVVGASGQAVDLALQNSLTNTNLALFSYGTPGLSAWCQYNGTTQYHSIADNAAHDILGTETYLAGTVRGLSIGMWVRPLALTGATNRMFTKGTTTGNARAYGLRQNASDQFAFAISDNGTNDTSINSSPFSFSANTWYFVVGIYEPSTDITLYVGSSEEGFQSYVNSTSIPASLNNSATGLAIGAQADGTSFSNIRASLCFVSCERLDEPFIFSLFEQSRVIFDI